MSNKKFVYLFLGIFTLILLVSAMPVLVVDPFFHYHKPLKGLSYRLNGNIERYLNDGILRHFDYDTVIMGSSMCQNFKASEAARLFGGSCVKTAMSGATSKELGEQLKRAAGYNKGLRTVIMGFDRWYVLWDKDWYQYDDIPFYLYDKNILNDSEYLYNRDVLELEVKKVLNDTFEEELPPDFDFDNYGSWMKYFEGKTGKDYILGNEYFRSDSAEPDTPFDDEDRERVRDILEQNFLKTVRDNPDITFYIFFPPHSVLYFDKVTRSGEYTDSVEGLRYAAKLLLGCDNVRLFMFYDDYDLITDLDMYKDEDHYVRSVNSDILKYMAEGKYILTEENCDERFDSIARFYRDYDYDRIFG